MYLFVRVHADMPTIEFVMSFKKRAINQPWPGFNCSLSCRFIVLNASALWHGSTITCSKTGQEQMSPVVLELLSWTTRAERYASSGKSIPLKKMFLELGLLLRDERDFWDLKRSNVYSLFVFVVFFLVCGTGINEREGPGPFKRRLLIFLICLYSPANLQALKNPLIHYLIPHTSFSAYWTTVNIGLHTSSGLSSPTLEWNRTLFSNWFTHFLPTIWHTGSFYILTCRSSFIFCFWMLICWISGKDLL